MIGKYCTKPIFVIVSCFIMDFIEEMLVALWDVWVEMFGAIMKVLPKFISFLLWALAAIVILPCVFVAGNIFPRWVEWGEDF